MQALALVAGLIVLVLGTVVPFMMRKPLMPEMISGHGHVIDNQIYLTMYITGAIFVLAQLALAYMIFVYQGKGQKAKYVHGNMLVEWGSIISSGVLFVGLNLMGQGVWADMHLKDKPTDAVRIEVNGQQFKWYFRYAGNDGQFGNREPRLTDDSAQNYLGVDFENDTFAKDDYVGSTLKVPYDRDIVTMIRSRDVIHNFAVRELRVKQDAVPGLEVKVPFRVLKQGMFKFTLTGVAAAALDAKDVSAVKAQFESQGIKITEKAEIRIIEAPKKRWELKTHYISHYAPADKFWPVTYSIEDEDGKLNVYKTSYEVVCAELCGNGHYTMRADMEVLSPEEYAAWIKKESEDAKSYR